jgi:uncharacterized paraquat-inducible protein A
MSTLFALFFLISIFIFIVHIVICIWGFRDALRRTGRQEMAILVLIAMFVFPLLGPIVYLFIRNDLRS